MGIFTDLSTAPVSFYLLSDDRSVKGKSLFVERAMFSQFVSIMLRALLLLLLLTATNVIPEEVCVKSGEMELLECSSQKSQVNWSFPQSRDLERAGPLNYHGKLLFLNVSKIHQGNYSCQQGTVRNTFELMVDTLPSPCENKSKSPQTCKDGTACELFCPKLYNITPKEVTWQKNCTITNERCYFSKVKKSDQGVYSCIRSFEYDGHIYKKTFWKILYINPKDTIINRGILSPHPDEVFQVEIGSSTVINCTAVISDKKDDIYWMHKDEYINMSDNSTRIYSSSSKEGMKKTASLIFKEVCAEDLSTVFTCILEPGSSVNVTLKQKARPSYVAVTIFAVVVPVVLVLSVLISIKYKIHITLFLRDTLGYHHRVLDGKSFDACIMYYTCEQEAGLSEDDRRTLQSMLEDHFGYSLCLFDRDVLPGKALADAMLESVEQSRAVLLVPASPNLSPESSLLSAIHEALVERQTRLVSIQNKSTEKKGLKPVPPEILELIALGHCVTWTGSFDKSSFFWKQLRYYLPPVQHPQMSLLPETV